MRFVLLALLLFAAALQAPAHASSSFGAEVADVARIYRDKQPKLSMATCNGLIEDILRDVGVPMRGNVRTLFADMDAKGWVHRRKVPSVGDIVFFDSTYDSNRNGRQDDPLSHVAVVISVEPDGTIQMVHHGSKGIRPLTMNLRDPSARRAEDGKVLNSYLGAPGYAQEGRRLAGELWRAFATPQRGGSALVATAPPPRAGAASKVPKRAAYLPVGLGDPALRRAWEGRRLREQDIAGRTCRELWFLRNAIYASHGFVFTVPEADAAFRSISTYAPNPGLSREALLDGLTGRDRANAHRIHDREVALGCRR
jgi:hypothetical protein